MSHDSLCARQIHSLALVVHWRAYLQGTSTVCILALEDNKLHAANLGDSGFLVVRKQKVVFRCPSQQHRFNFPYQLGCPGTQSDLPEHAEASSLSVQHASAGLLRM